MILIVVFSLSETKIQITKDIVLLYHTGVIQLSIYVLEIEKGLSPVNRILILFYFFYLAKSAKCEPKAE